MLYNTRLVTLIAFTGKAGSGKSTCCELLQQLGRDNGLKIARVSFADPLKRVCSDIYCFAYDLPPEAFYGNKTQKEQVYESLGNRSGREILQFLGTGCFKALTPDVWVNYFKRHCEVVLKYGADLIIVDDLRFTAEANAIRELGGLVIKVERSNVKSNGNHTNAHISETEQDLIDPDEIIWNDGDALDLQRTLQRLL